MLAYQIRIALISLRRTPVLSSLLVIGIALGVAVATAFVTAYYVMSGDPIPHKSDQLYYIELDSWDPDEPFDRSNPERTPNQVTYRDMIALRRSEIPTLQTAMFKANLTIHPEGEQARPYRETIRMCTADFFSMFEVPFIHGGGWDRSADLNTEPVVVIDDETNRKLFGGENSVGKTILIEDRRFTVTGVIAHWRPTPKFYDPHNGPFQEAEAVYMPIDLAKELEITSAGNSQGWKRLAENSYAGFLESELIWIQMWVQLDTAQQRDRYLSFLDAYATDQKRLGRFLRPLNNRLLTVMEFLHDEDVVPEMASGMVVISLLFLFICSVNLIGILLGKLLGRAPEVGVRRALGASRASVFFQHLVECELIGLLGGVLGLGLSVLLLKMINRMFETGGIYQLDLIMVGAGLVLSLGSGLIAGLYPSWQICRLAPAVYLKQ
jgi:putative ABC transport system permease protein